ncbi:MAG: undecaprenyl-diphosphatase [Flavisolibacter sp.]
MVKFLIFCAEYLYLVIFLIAGVFFLRLKKRQDQINMFLFGLACAIVSYLLALLFGQLYFDPRPFVQGHFKPLIVHDAENGFPSDHVLLVSIVAAVLTVFNKPISALLWILTIVVAYARVFVGVHHIIDVATSIIISILVVITLYFTIYQRLEGKLNQKIERIIANKG